MVSDKEQEKKETFKLAYRVLFIYLPLLMIIGFAIRAVIRYSSLQQIILMTLGYIAFYYAIIFIGWFAYVRKKLNQIFKD